MKIDIGNKSVVSVDFSNFETAWKINDAILVIQYLKSKNTIILGGDILTDQLEYNYDSWYYNKEVNQTFHYNVEYSTQLASRYISDYIRANGNAFYVIFVTEPIITN